MKFTDLFAGLGGFHRALANLGHDCVLASEVHPALVDLYELNHSIRPMSDVTKVTVEDIPEHDMLCVEFPSQPFLKAEAQLGREDPGSGTLFALYVSQVHERAIVVAKQGKGALVDFVWQGRRRSCDELDIRGILEELANDAKYLPKKLFFTSMRGSVFAIFTQKTCQCRPFQYGQKSLERATLMYRAYAKFTTCPCLKGASRVFWRITDRLLS